MPVENRSVLAERLEQGVDDAVEVGIALPLRFDLPDRVDHGRVVLPAEAPADFRERRVGERLQRYIATCRGTVTDFALLRDLRSTTRSL